jgi:hypothetical protein
MAGRRTARGPDLLFGAALAASSVGRAAAAVAKARKNRQRTYYGDGFSDAKAPAPQGPPTDELLAWAKQRRRAR